MCPFPTPSSSGPPQRQWCYMCKLRSNIREMYWKKDFSSPVPVLPIPPKHSLGSLSCKRRGGFLQGKLPTLIHGKWEVWKPKAFNSSLESFNPLCTALNHLAFLWLLRCGGDTSVFLYRGKERDLKYIVVTIVWGKCCPPVLAFAQLIDKYNLLMSRWWLKKWFWNWNVAYKDRSLSKERGVSQGHVVAFVKIGASLNMSIVYPGTCVFVNLLIAWKTPSS